MLRNPEKQNEKIRKKEVAMLIPLLPVPSFALALTTSNLVHLRSVLKSSNIYSLIFWGLCKNRVIYSNRTDQVYQALSPAKKKKKRKSDFGLPFAGLVTEGSEAASLLPAPPVSVLENQCGFC